MSRTRLSFYSAGHLIEFDQFFVTVHLECQVCGTTCSGYRLSFKRIAEICQSGLAYAQATMSIIVRGISNANAQSEHLRRSYLRTDSLR